MVQHWWHYRTNLRNFILYSGNLRIRENRSTGYRPPQRELVDGGVAVHLVANALSDALADEHEVGHLDLLQLEPAVENTEVELTTETDVEGFTKKCMIEM